MFIFIYEVITNFLYLFTGSTDLSDRVNLCSKQVFFHLKHKCAIEKQSKRKVDSLTALMLLLFSHHGKIRVAKSYTCHEHYHALLKNATHTE